MTRILHVKASPNRRHSHSATAAEAFLDALASGLPNADIDTIDVWDLPLPEFDHAMIEAKFAVLRSLDATEAQQQRWEEAVRIAQRFNRADLYVFSVPMWNFGVPYRLKHFIDIVTLPGQNWTWSRAQGYVPLLRDKRAVLVLSSASLHDDDVPAGFARSDFQRMYLQRWLAFIGVEVAGEIRVSPTLTDPGTLERIRDDAEDQARRLARAISEEAAHASLAKHPSASPDRTTVTRGA